MTRFRRKTAIAAAVIAVSSLAAGGVVAGTRSSDEAALEPTRQSADRGIERDVDRLLRRMTLEEKLQQLQLLSDVQITDADARNGVGSVFSLTDPARIRELQRIAVEESRLGIPILFAFDTIHGYRTVFPIPLGTGASFDPQMAFDDARFGARESAAVGLKQTYAPMVDVSHEPRWGRISEAAGEDPYLNSALGAARVKGTQGRDYSRRDKLAASPKHLVAYGAARGRARLQHDGYVGVAAAQHVPAAVQGRDRRRRRHDDVLVQRHQRRPRLRERGHHERGSSRASGTSTASSRATTPRSASCGHARGRTPKEGRAATASPPTARTPQRRRSTPASTPRW